MTPVDETSPSGRNVCTMRYFGRATMDIFFVGLDLSSGERTDRGLPMGPRATLAVSP